MGISPVILGAPPPTISVSGGDDGSNDSSGWLSGLGDLFSGVGTAVASGLKAANTPSLPTAGAGWVYNPATGNYINPVTGQALTATGTLTSAGALSQLGGGNFFTIALLGVVAYLLFKKAG